MQTSTYKQITIIMSTFHPAALIVCAKSLSMQISDLADLVLYFTSGALEITQNDCRRGVQVNTLDFM